MGRQLRPNTKPYYPTWLEESRTLSQILAEEKLAEGPKLNMERLTKRLERNMKNFISCADCQHWDKRCKLDGKCTNLGGK